MTVKQSLSSIITAHNLGKAEISGEVLRENIGNDIENQFKKLEALRAGGKDKKPVDMTWGEFVKEAWAFTPNEKTGSPDALYESLGIDPGGSTVASLLTTPEFNSGFRWLVPEIFREAIRLGLRKTPIWNKLTIADEAVSQPSLVMPQIQMSDATPTKIGEGETIPVGTVDFNQKTVKLSKVATGIELPDEVIQYVNLNIVSLYLQDVGIKLGLALDVMAIDTLINGDQADGSEAAPVIGVNAGSAFAYRDFLRAWMRGNRLGRPYQGFLAGEDAAINVLELAEFKALAGTGTLVNLNVSTPVPRSQSVWVHGYMPANQVMLVDPTGALIKLTSSALRVESDRIVNRQINGTFVSLTTGFANVFRDARLIMDQSVAFSGFPAWMNPSIQESAGFKNQ